MHSAGMPVITSANLPVRVAHLTPAFFSPDSVVGGGERYVYYLARALAEADPDGFSQTILTLGTEEASFVYEGLPVTVLRNENPAPNFLNGTSSLLWQMLDGIDVLHIHQSLTGFGAYCTAMGRSLGKTLILTDLGGGESPLMLAGGGLKLADGLVSISRYAASLVAPSFNGPHAILVGPVDTDAFTPSGFAYKAQPPVAAIAVSRILPHKGIDRLIAALPQGLPLRVVGTVYDQQYYRLLREMAAGKDVTFIHDANDARLRELYRTSTLFLQGSTTRDIYGNVLKKPELMGLTTLEAMACGLPVIVSDAGSLPELVPDERFGRIFSDHDELTAMLQDFVQGRWPSAMAGELARAHVIEHHGFDAIGHRLGAFYRQVHLHEKSRIIVP